MIRGLGIDLVENFRIKKIYERYGYKFAKRILDNEEIEILILVIIKFLFLLKD